MSPKSFEENPKPFRGRLLSLAMVLCAMAISAGCARPSAVVIDELLEPLSAPKRWIPSPADLAAARLARAALVTTGAPEASSDPVGPQVSTGKPTKGAIARVSPAVEAALAGVVDAQDRERTPHLVPIAIDLRNATVDDPIAYRQGARELRRRWDVDPRLEGRLDRTVGDDPLELAGRRQFDGWHRLWARTFNAVAEPLGTSAITGFVIAPFQLANSLIHYFAEFSNAEPLSNTDRQALALRQEFVERHPESPVAPQVRKKIDRDQPKLAKTRAKRRLRAAESAMKSGQPALTEHHAAAALEILEDHPEHNKRVRKKATRLRERATALKSEESERRQRTLKALPTPAPLRDIETQLATTLLAGRPAPGTLEGEFRALNRATQEGSSASADASGMIGYVRAMTQHENGFEAAARRGLARIAARSPSDDRGARHARALLEDDWQNPHGAFERLNRKAARDELAFRLAGEWVARPRYPNLPTPVAYLIDTPSIAMTLVLAPVRALVSPWTGGADFQRGASVAAYRYLVRYPDGEEQRPVIDWLYDYETRHERWGRALRLADWIPEFDASKRNELVEKTAEDRLNRVDRLDRRDARASILRGLAREFPDSEGGQIAGLQARQERERASPQNIRITKDFLRENPSVAGESGIGLAPHLMNDDPGDGELHPEGVVLLGARAIEIRLIAEGAGERDLPTRRTRKVSEQRLIRITARLDEAVRRNSLIDVDARHRADANRDLYLERAALGLTEEADLRPTAESSFVYQSLKERYGLVRGRDSLLPFDLVFRGSLGDFSLGAFPRWRAPRETPDAYLYR